MLDWRHIHLRSIKMVTSRPIIGGTAPPIKLLGAHSSMPPKFTPMIDVIIVVPECSCATCFINMSYCVYLVCKCLLIIVIY